MFFEAFVNEARLTTHHGRQMTHGTRRTSYVRKRAKIKKRYNQTLHLTQDTHGKVTTSQLDISNESQEVSPILAGDHKASTNRHESITKQDRININDPQKKHCLGTVSKNISLEGLNRFKGAPTSPLVQLWFKLMDSIGDPLLAI